MTILQKSVLLAASMILAALALTHLPHGLEQRWVDGLPLALLVFLPWALKGRATGRDCAICAKG